MDNINKYNKIFILVFDATEEDLNNDFDINSVDNWDSITQLTLVNEIEDEFDVMFDPEDILELRSYEIGKEILLKYSIAV